MAKALEQWIEQDVAPYRDKSMAWLSQYHFFRDPFRPTYTDDSFFFAPADGVVLYQKLVAPDEAIVEIKGRPYSLRDAMRDDSLATPCLVVGIFMTFFDVHVNRVPFTGRLSYQLLEPIETHNQPMIEVERRVLDELRVDLDGTDYLYVNQRMLNRVDSLALGQPYYMIQIADYDVDSIAPFELRQNQPVDQGQRFSQIRYGSQVDLVVPLSAAHEFEPIQPDGVHVEAGLDPLVRIRHKRR